MEEVITLNEKALKAIYKEYSTHNRDDILKKYNADYMILEDCVDLLKFHCPLRVSRYLIREAYALSKMTVLAEHDAKAELAYKKLQYVEFLEFLARIADLFFEGSEMEGLELHEKIEHILDEILPLVGAKRVKQKIVIEEFSESDDDY